MILVLRLAVFRPFSSAFSLLILEGILMFRQVGLESLRGGLAYRQR